MKLTQCLQRKNYYWLLQQMWKYGRSRIKPTFLNTPLYLKKQGTPLLTALDILKMDKQVFAKWEPPVKDDPRVALPPEPQTHPHYHHQPIYQFTPHTQLEEGETQACILTKSQPLYHLPPSLCNLIGQLSVPDQDTLTQRVIMHAHQLEPTKVKLPKRKDATMPIWNFKAEVGIPDIKIAKVMMEGVVGICNSLIGRHSDLATSRTLVNNPMHSTHFAFNGDTDISIKATIDLVSYSSKLLPNHASHDIIDQSTSYTLPSIHPLSPTIDLTKQHIWTLENNLGYRGSFAFPYPQTLFHCHDDVWNFSQRNARSLMLCFGSAVGIAKNLYGKGVTDLPEPISTQCIMTNGVSFSFTCFQLNSLNYSSPIKNLVWFDSENELVKKIIPKRGMLRHTKYEDYNPQVIRKVLAFYANGADLTKIDFFP